MRLIDTFLRICCLAPLAFLLPGVPDCLAGQRHAVLVGVSEYPNVRIKESGGRVDLRGPRNDVRLMHDVLRLHGFEPSRITVLADGASADLAPVLPTRANILSALDRTIAMLGPGDFLYIHFSGHGSQQPERVPGQELDGSDEIFLARDASRWNPARRTVEGAIIDDEIADRIAAAQGRGATVWSVFDTCHAGSMTRSIGFEPRKLSPEDLDIPFSTPSSRPATSAGKRKSALDKALPGGAVAFFATGAHAITPEFRPRVLRDVHGLFTYVLVEGLRSYPGATYRQLGDFIQQRYGAIGAGSVASPLYEGDLDRPVFGDGSAVRLRQWIVRSDDASLWIDAGALSLFAEGARFALLKDPRAPLSEAVAIARASEVRPMLARLIPVDESGKSLALSERARLDGTFARLVDPNPGFQVRVAVSITSDAPRNAALDAQLQDLRAPAGRGPRVAWTEDLDDADLELRITRDRVFLRPRWDPLVENGPSATMSVPLPRPSAGPAAYDALGAELRDSLRRVAKSVNLLRVASQNLTDPESASFRSSFLVQRNGENSLVPLKPGELAELYPKDTVQIEVENRGREVVAVTVLAIDAQHRISTLFPLEGNSDNLVAPGLPPRFLDSGFTIIAGTAGVERVVVLAARGRTGGNFRYLADDAPVTKGAVTRGVGGDGSSFDMLDEAMGETVPATKGVTRDISKRRGETAIQVFTWRTMPPKK